MFFSDEIAKKREVLGNHVSDFSFTLSIVLKLYHMHMMRSAQEIGLSRGQPRILMSLATKNLQTQKELSDFFQVKPASMTDTLKRMERDELIERVRDEKDMRNIRVSLTPKGWDKFHAFIKKGASIDEVAFVGFTEKERDVCLKLFMRILDNLNKELQEMRE
ncbi:putative HTH-type transcriptional regulator YusO [Anaerotignum neopropionicum]|uniref:Putative HTH-type transcriptional regulator YusO n=1 Tax=Anaerotignum neopropionicum TaxID=36847 RepID=A0A136WFI1_9FIRM|nr:MarR family transcriptional regulator [Anaerotignum neopropionicum]KXL53200.1 putative HTH-type transcriptional regulator YusO [Anaerotignum neopropionicum]